MSELPPRARLLHVLRSLAAALPAQMAGLIEAPRFAEGAASLARLTDPVWAQEAADTMAPGEIAWMTDRLLERWARIAPVVLEPAVAVIVPDEIWLGDRAARVPVSLATFGIDDDWDAVWEGAVTPGPPAKTSVLVAQPPAGDAPAEVVVRARVRARAGGQRCVLIAEARVRLRCPRVTASDDGRRLVVSDQAGRPAVAVRVEIADQTFTSGPSGLVELTREPPPDTAVRVEGISAGRTRARST